MINLNIEAFVGVAIILSMIVVLATRKQRGQNQTRVVYVIDGDTFVVAQAGERVRVRVIGIDTPEGH